MRSAIPQQDIWNINLIRFQAITTREPLPLVVSTISSRPRDLPILRPPLRALLQPAILRRANSVLHTSRHSRPIRDSLRPEPLMPTISSVSFAFSLSLKRKKTQLFSFELVQNGVSNFKELSGSSTDSLNVGENKFR